MCSRPSTLATGASCGGAWVGYICARGTEPPRYQVSTLPSSTSSGAISSPTNELTSVDRPVCGSPATASRSGSASRSTWRRSQVVARGLSR
jgi:hypothetical protein